MKMPPNGKHDSFNSRLKYAKLRKKKRRNPLRRSGYRVDRARKLDVILIAVIAVIRKRGRM